MTEKSFIRADEVAEELDVSKSYAYKVIKQLNDELSAKGYNWFCQRQLRRRGGGRFQGGERAERHPQHGGLYAPDGPLRLCAPD